MKVSLALLAVAVAGLLAYHLYEANRPDQTLAARLGISMTECLERGRRADLSYRQVEAACSERDFVSRGPKPPAATTGALIKWSCPNGTVAYATTPICAGAEALPSD